MSEPNLDELLGVIGGITDKLAKIPEGAEIFQKLRKGEITAEEAVGQLLPLIKGAGLLPDMLAAQAQVTGITGHFGDLEASRRPIMMQTSTGQPQLNPIYEAAIIERASLDGDVPELRYGPLPEDGSPAVPVLTRALDPVIVGMQLERASETVQRRIDDALEDHAAACTPLLEQANREAAELGLDPETALAVAKKLLPAVPTGVEGYQAGENPSLMVMPDIPITDIIRLTDAQASHYAYQALATTQGRVTLSHPIQEKVLDQLILKGFQVEPGSPNPDQQVTATWTMRAWGSDDFSGRFNFTLVAIGSLATSLAASAMMRKEIPQVLSVTPFNGIADRQFGWLARLGPRS